MEFALSETNERIIATPHAKGFCSICRERMISKCGLIKTHHWAHKSKINCDPWWEPESDWHRKWKEIVDEQFREVVIEKDGLKHRADIRLLSGVVIELQKSTLPYGERLDREIFYENMFWIIHFPREKIVSSEKIYKKKLFNDYRIEVKHFSKWIYQPPHSSPIFLDFNDGDMFWINEFDTFDHIRNRFFYGQYLKKNEFVKKYLRSLFFDIETLKLSNLHRDDYLEQLRISENLRKKQDAEFRKKQEEMIEQHKKETLEEMREYWEKKRITELKEWEDQKEQQRKQEEKKIIEVDKNFKWGLELEDDYSAFFEREQRVMDLKKKK